MIVLLAPARGRRVLTVYMIGELSVSIGAGLVIVFVSRVPACSIADESSGTSWNAGLTIGGLALLAAVSVALRADERMRKRRRPRRGTSQRSSTTTASPLTPRHEAREAVLGSGSEPTAAASQ